MSGKRRKGQRSDEGRHITGTRRMGNIKPNVECRRPTLNELRGYVLDCEERGDYEWLVLETRQDEDKLRRWWGGLQDIEGWDRFVLYFRDCWLISLYWGRLGVRPGMKSGLNEISQRMAPKRPLHAPGGCPSGRRDEDGWLRSVVDSMASGRLGMRPGV